jgi:transcriptional regulator with XRE-family HTH domain
METALSNVCGALNLSPCSPSHHRTRSPRWGAWLAHDLRFSRNQRGLSGDAVAKLINCARSSLSRLENGEAKLDEGQAAKLDERWQTGGHFGTILWYARLGHDPNWFKQHLDIESEASVIKVFEALVIPGLLQLPEYAYQLITAGGPPDIDELLAERMSRQAVFGQGTSARALGVVDRERARPARR